MQTVSDSFLNIFGLELVKKVEQEESDDGHFPHSEPELVSDFLKLGVPSLLHLRSGWEFRKSKMSSRISTSLALDSCVQIGKRPLQAQV